MAAEKGHAPNRVYIDQSGALHLNGAALFDASEVDQSATLGGGQTTVAGVGSNYKIARGQLTNATASDTVVTGLTTVVAAVASLEAGPVVGSEVATARVGDQAGTPAAGSIFVETWKTLGGTPAAATTFSLAVNWIAIGT